MNILIFTTLEFNISCAARQRLSRLASSLDASGHHSYLTFSTSEEVQQPYLLDNKQIIFPLACTFNFSLLSRNKQQVVIFRQYVPSLVRSLSIDIIILYSTFSDVIDPINSLCTTLGIPLVMDGGEFYSLNPNNFLNFTNYLQYKAKLFSYPKVSGMICCSPRQYRYANFHNIPAALVPAFSPCSTFDDTTIIHNTSSPFNVLLLASLTPRESPLAIINAVIAARKLGMDIHLNIVGRYNSSLIQKITFLRLKRLIARNKFVHLHGFLNESDFNSVLSNSNCCVIIRSHSKESTHAFPTRIPEIITKHIPLILSDTEPFNMFFLIARTHFFIDRNAETDLVSAFTLLSSNPSLSLDLIDNALMLAKREFSQHVLGRRVSNLLSSLIND